MALTESGEGGGTGGGVGWGPLLVVHTQFAVDDDDGRIDSVTKRFSVVKWLRVQRVRVLI